MRRFTIQYDKGEDGSMPTSKEEDKVSLKELRENLYELRNFEISNLWQRSIFLSAILVLLFTGYGGSCVKLIECSTTDAYWFNLLSLAISVIGLCFSCLWIMMAKGSKMWYEVYENRIFDIEKKPDLGIDTEWRMESGRNPEGKETKLMNTNAGAYSVSRINILIGHVMLVIWLVTILVHTVIFIISMSQEKSLLQILLNAILTAVIVLASISLIICILSRLARSQWSRKDK